MKFHIIVAMYNVDEWIEENIQLLKKQTFKNFQAIFIDDLSSDKTVSFVQSAVNNDPRFNLVVNQEKKFKTRNVVEAIEIASPADDDVIVLVDGDDRLSNENVLQILYDTYNDKDCWMTYGSYSYSDGSRYKKCSPYQKAIIDNNQYRKTSWLASHLKTFKYKLWKQLDMSVFQVSPRDIKRARLRALLKLQLRTWYYWKNITAEDLHDESGRYIRRIDDKALSFALLEMSGDRAQHIENELYVHRSERAPYSGPDETYGKGRSEKWHSRLIRDVILHQKPYSRRKFL
ncbi:hypothetical protein MNBD_GAMMA09-3052 [hydrothermal vent metagenome]|uniref:Glycosyltransferase 2-like domain-containing protein n=1 Tax=hydrothermal vent metagenome TaxID=652676 RepID=A0A3B0YEJ3_9ZZZZ